MKFFYNLERTDFGEYITIEITDNKNSGIGAIVPERYKGENYKVIMGAIEEYRYVVEKATIKDTFSIPYMLEEHFPNHPKVIFAIDAAFKELYSKTYNIPLQKLLGRENIQECKVENGEKIFPEEYGIIDLVKVLPLFDDYVFMLTKYPKGEMHEVLRALSTNFKHVEVFSWKERLFI
ncbi:hypothetical protein SU69_01985 [Thermosipho melanesiensis]|uniref:Uncharacterized protein n=2 Tax=Thermosipho melanesiensis TaxID=46541 RepID=A6LJZ8_THEM4|nr:hypothetical protein [Thermosipho melanesiensis]ABR30249.1 hypothetical protein Tmel_0380 [Thermosipho melanesiensis BI429]APT73437.1 hypothetical protein BW47_02065 [Thermosipho melanesiensis]OOC37380.1 hypothetical protein SU68_01995 [Thermosipho melanesiensis]OOC39742.1 hypothetical protein SU69_01985 [Thermosipho melanesiensis]OOC39847.1 hypothetical protein SU70_01980 [Thermosipho melanesiensis]